MTPLSLRIARTLLFLSAGLAAVPPFLILWMSSEPFASLHYQALFFLAAAGFMAAGVQLARRPERARLLAWSAALTYAAMGTMAGFSLGMITIPGAALGVAAAWATLLQPPRRSVVVAFAIYVAVGATVLLSRGTFAPIFAIPTILIWPMWVALIGASSILPLYVALAAAAVLATRALLPPPAFGARSASLPLAAGIGIIAGVAALVGFIAWAYARPDTSARFELTPLVLAVVAVGGLLFGAGVATVRSTGSLASAAALGLGATLLLLTFTYRPAVTCQPSGQSQGLPLEWALTSMGSQSAGGSGSSGAIGPGGERTIQSGEFTYGGRRAVYRCDGATVVEYREVR